MVAGVVAAEVLLGDAGRMSSVVCGLAVLRDDSRRTDDVERGDCPSELADVVPGSGVVATETMVVVPDLLRENFAFKRTGEVELVDPISELADAVLGSGLVAIETTVVNSDLWHSPIQQLNLRQYLAHSVGLKSGNIPERFGELVVTGLYVREQFALVGFTLTLGIDDLHRGFGIEDGTVALSRRKGSEFQKRFQDGR